MFNEDLKHKFIIGYSESSVTRKTLQRLFDALSRYEAALDKDICSFSPDELQPAIDEIFGGRTSGSCWTSISALREYFKWCMESKIPNARDAISHVNLLGLNKFKKTMVSGPLHLHNWMNCLFEPEDLDTIGNVYRCYFWMAFFGLSNEDAVLVKKSDVDLPDMEISFEDKHFQMYRESIKTFRTAATLTEFNFVHPLYREITKKPRYESEYLMAGTKGLLTISGLGTLYSSKNADAISQGKTDIRLKYNKVWLSGCFYRIYEAERAGLRPDFAGMAADYVEGKEYAPTAGRTDQKDILRWKIKRKMAEYESDYIRWKLCFSI